MRADFSHILTIAEKQIGKYKIIKEVKLSEKFALAAMQVAEKNELLQIYCEELQPFFKK